MIANVLRKLRRRLRPGRWAARPSVAKQGIGKSTAVTDKPIAPAEGPSLWTLLGPYIPNDHALQVNARYYLDKVMSGPDAPRHVLDLGCGNGNSVDAFRGHDASIDWVGVDIGDSQEVRARRRTDATFVTYDGTRVPFPDGTFDLVYSSQVLEHVPDPLLQLREIARVLRAGGMFIGSTSQLEPYHSMSYWNITPFGFVALVRAAGLQVLELRPGIDGVTLAFRSYFGRPSGFDVWWNSESPLNAEIDAWGRETGRRPALINLRKLQMCGQFAFLVTREAAADA
jgi:SAM-dependent methyltransferase